MSQAWKEPSAPSHQYKRTLPEDNLLQIVPLPATDDRLPQHHFSLNYLLRGAMFRSLAFRPRKLPGDHMRLSVRGGEWGAGSMLADLVESHHLRCKEGSHRLDIYDHSSSSAAPIQLSSTIPKAVAALCDEPRLPSLVLHERICKHVLVEEQRSCHECPSCRTLPRRMVTLCRAPPWPS